MQYDVKTPKEYLVNLQDDWRKDKLEQVRQIIKKCSPNLDERIEYKMLSFAKDGKTIFNLNAQRAYVSLYVGTINKVDNAKELLKDFDIGKGCIRIKKTVQIPETDLEKFIKKTLALWESGGNTEC